MDDQTLVTSILAGNNHSFDDLMNRYKNKVYGMFLPLVLNQETARDLTQEVFIKIFNNLNQYDNQYSLGGWIYRIAKNTAFDYLRKIKNKQEYSFDETFDQPCNEVDPAKIYEKRATINALHKVIEELPSDLKEIFILKYFEDLAYKEIAVKMKLPESTIQNRLYKARQIVRKALLIVEEPISKEVIG